MIDPAVTEHLKKFTNTENVRAVFARTLPFEFSRSELLKRLSEAKSAFPESPLRERIFGEPEFLAKSPDSPRAREWELSRQVLLAAVEGLATQDLRISLAHADGAALAIAATRGGSGVGVDLERIGREVSDAAFSRFFRPEEGAYLKEPLDHWVLKEACYKAHPRSAETIIADYVVTALANDEFTVLCTKGAPERFRAALGTRDEFRYAIARHLPEGQSS